MEQSINYATTAFDEMAKDVDVVLDLIGGETQERSWKVLKPGGILVTSVHALIETRHTSGKIGLQVVH